ncbi:MAG: hypothetical protein CSB01_01235 [Bacteroidia bacterium]|nr:MAG: hypothetical protein CSB01_01235 [Bacteroidia bacterium]
MKAEESPQKTKELRMDLILLFDTFGYLPVKYIQKSLNKQKILRKLGRNDYLTLWTIQPIERYKQLEKDRIIFGRIDLSDWYKDDNVKFRQTYDWLVSQMEKRISPKPFEDALPIWAWYQYLNANRKRPDLRNSNLLPRGQKGVRIEFRKKKSEVLLSDFELWHSPLNYFYIADNEKEDKEFNALLNACGVKFIDKEKYPPYIRKKVEDSWVKIFDMDYCPKYSASPFDKKSIQATFWNLSVDEIIKVDKFVAR